MFKSWLMLIFMGAGVVSDSAFAGTVVLIPGAASSGGRISLIGLERVFGSWEHWNYFDRFQREFVRLGHRVEVCPRIPDGDQGGLEERARDCENFLVALPAHEPVWLIGHSLGGLVGRRLLANPSVASKVRALVTISTPHRGTPLADLLRSASPETSVIRTAARLAGFRPDQPRYVRELGWRVGTKDSNLLGIPVYSIANHAEGFVNMPAFEWTGEWLSRELLRLNPRETRHDGIVPLASMVYGTLLGVVEADHMESACILQGQWSAGCEQVLRLLKPLLRN